MVLMVVPTFLYGGSLPLSAAVALGTWYMLVTLGVLALAAGMILSAYLRERKAATTPVTSPAGSVAPANLPAGAVRWIDEPVAEKGGTPRFVASPLPGWLHVVCPSLSEQRARDGYLLGSGCST